MNRGIFLLKIENGKHYTTISPAPPLPRRIVAAFGFAA